MITLSSIVRLRHSEGSPCCARLGLLLTCALLTMAPSALAAVRYVDNSASVPGPRDGTSWSRAYSTIQAGINAATSGVDEVWVANGTYVEGSADPTNGSLELKANVPVYGGFSGYGTFASGNYNETSTAQRNWLRHQTIINGATARGGSAAYTVVGVGVDGATLDGFFIQGGNANAAYSSNPNADVGETFRGGGMFILTRSVTVRNCWFRNNNAGIAGGAVAISTCYTGVKTVLFKDCIFQSNTCQRNGNTADIGLGGAMNILRSSPTIDGCIFFSNTGRYGGAIYSVWSDNSPAGSPNGVASETPIIRNSLFYGNTAQESGGAIYCHNSNALITHCTITSNGAGASAFEVPANNQGGGFVASNVPILPRVGVPGAGTADPGNANLQNNFFAGNTGGTGAGQIIARAIGTAVTLAQTPSPNIQNAGVGMFQNAANRDYRLLTTDTIALNRGTFTAQTPPQDGFGVTRPNGAVNGATANDAGAYERDSQNPVITTKTANKVLDANGEAFVYIDDVLNTATDNDTSLVYSLTSIGTVANAATYGTIVNYATVTSAQLFTCANIGANTVTLYAMDNDGRLVSATATVNISETTPPVLVTANPSPVNVGSGSATVPAASFVSNVSDNCGGTVTTLVRRGANAFGPSVDFTCSDAGSNVTVNIQSTDANGNSTTSSVVVSVVDSNGPSLTTANPGPIAVGSGTPVVVNAASFLGSASDTCGGAITTQVRRGAAAFGASVTFTCADAGNNVSVDVRATDARGASTTLPVLVAVQDTVPPTLSTVNPGPIGVGGGLPVAVGAASFGTANDACGGALALSVRRGTDAFGPAVNFTCADAGSTVTVDVRATDAQSNQGTGSVAVSVVDTDAPAISVINPGPIEVGSGTPQVISAAAFGSATDGCEGTLPLSVRRGADPFGASVSFGCADAGGSVPVEVQGMDSAGNSSTVIVNVAVVDTVPPVITPLSPAPIEVGNGDIAVPAATFATAADACNTAALAVRFTGSGDPFGPSVLFTCTRAGALVDVDVEATDAFGRTSTATVQVQAVDTVIPTGPAIGEDITVQLDAFGAVSLTESDIAAMAPSAADICGVDLTATLQTASPGNFLCVNNGVNIVTFRVRDRQGNEAANATVANVTVEDNLNPTAVPLATLITVNLSSPILSGLSLDGGSTDNCEVDEYLIDGNPTRTFNCSEVGAPVGVTLTVIDDSGNDASAAATVQVVDDVDPIASCVAGPIPLALDDSGNATLDINAVNNGSSDNCTAVPALQISRTDFTCADVGMFPTVTLTVTDDAGNDSTCDVQIEVLDVTPPVITLLGGAIEAVTQNMTYTDPGVLVADVCDPAVPPIVGGFVNTSVLGPYVLTYDAVDASGNNAIQVTRTVTVVPDNPPVITLTGANPLTFECGTPGGYVDPGATANDIENGALTPTILSNGVQAGVLGQYVVTWTVTDSFPTTVTLNRIVNVVDTTPPVITDVAGLESRECSIGYTRNDAVAAVGISDLCNVPPASALVIEARDSQNAVVSFPISALGQYTITYTITDLSLNTSAPLVRTIDIIDTTPPVLVDVEGPQTIECPGPYTLAAAKSTVAITDNCDTILNDELVVTVTRDALPESFPLTEVGTYTLSYAAADSEGNTGTTVRTVTISDTIRPVVSLIGASTVVVFKGTSFTDPGATASDSCAGGLPVTVGGDVVNVNAEGDYFVTYDAQDPSGNNAVTVTRRVTVTSFGGPPIIVTPPVDRTVDYNSNTTFVVVANAQGALSYQWQKDSVPLSNDATYSGVTTATLALTGVENADEGNYRVVVSNPDGSVTSSTARLTVNDPAIVQQPLDQAVGINVTATFTVGAVGSGTLTYRWYRAPNTPLTDGAKFSGTATENLSILNTQIADEAVFFVDVTGADGTRRSQSAELQVGDPIVVTNPVSQVVPPGTTVQFSVVATGTPPLSYVWQRNGVNMVDGGRISGSRTPILTIANVTDADEASYRARVVGINIVESASATLGVGRVPVIDRIIATPAGAQIPIGGFLSLAVVMADGDTPFTYQWFKDDVAVVDSPTVSGSTGPTLSFLNALASDAGAYRVVVSNDVGEDESATVDVGIGLSFSTNLSDATVVVDEPFTWNVVTTGALGNVTFQWLRETGTKTFVPVSGPAIFGANSDTLFFNPVSYDDAGRYVVEASDEFSTVQSRTARLTVVNALPLSGMAWLTLATTLLAAGGAWIMHRARTRAARNA